MRERQLDERASNCLVVLRTARFRICLAAAQPAQSIEIGLECRFVASDQPHQSALQRRRRVRQPVKHALAVAKPIEKPGRHQDLQVLGHPRLALAENLGQLRHAQLPCSAQRDDPQPLGVCKRFELFCHRVNSH